MKNTAVRQTTVRVDQTILRKARYYLDEEGMTVTDFITQQIERYVAEKEALQPVP